MSTTWFITGASRGFGRTWTVAALERGDRVAATARDTNALNDLIERFGDAVLPIRLDADDRDAGIAASKPRTGISADSTWWSTTRPARR